MEIGWESVLFLFAFGFIIKKFLIDPEKRIDKLIEDRKKEKQDDESIFEKKEDDFLGTKKAEENPISFLNDIREIEKKIADGKAIKVDAAKALYLMRNSKYHNLILGEDGTVNVQQYFKKTIEIEERAKSLLDDTSKVPALDDPNLLPYYVERVEYFGDNCIRWVYSKNHSEKYGVVSICFDAIGRPIGDPETITKRASGNSKENNSMNDKNNSLMNNFGKELSRIKEIVKDISFDNKLKEVDSKLPETNDDELNELSMIPMPDFDSSDSNSSNDSKDGHEINVNSPISNDLPKSDPRYGEESSTLCVSFIDDFDNSEELISSDDTITEIDEYDDFLNSHFSFDYESFAKFTSYEITKKSVNEIFDKLFDDKNSEKFFIDPDENIFCIHRSFFIETISECISEDRRSAFKKEMKIDGFGDGYSSEKTNTIALSINRQNDVFLTHGQNDPKVLFNLILDVEEVENLYVTGWFLKFKIKGCEQANELRHSDLQIASIKIVADKPKEIARKKKILGDNIKTLF